MSDYAAYEGKPATKVNTHKSFIEGLSSGLLSRKISKDICDKYGYQLGEIDGKLVHVANYFDDAMNLKAQKIRYPDKKFEVIGNATNMPFYGEWITTSDTIYITEGEIDALTIGQVLPDSYAVSVPFGAASAANFIKGKLDFLKTFTKIVLCFDSDDAGKLANRQCADILVSLPVYNIELPLKDANEMLLANREEELIQLLRNPYKFRPKDIVVSMSRDILLTGEAKGLPIQFPKLNKALKGLKKSRLYLLTAGSGIGKTTFAKELAYYQLTENNVKIGNVFLEEGMRDTGLSYMAIDNNVPLHELSENPTQLGEEKFEASYSKLFDKGNLVFWNHFGSLGSEGLISKLKYLIAAEGCQIVILDHISIAISGSDSSREGERKDIDKLMTNLKQLVQDTQSIIIAIVHLKRKDGTSFNDGGKVSLTDLRGSGALEQLSDSVIALERDQMNEQDKDKVSVKLLKNRITGEIGYQDVLYYMRDTGRLIGLGDAKL
jgi:twinkle protein